MTSVEDAVNWLRDMAAALRVYGRSQEDHDASFVLDQAADMMSGAEHSRFYPQKIWTDHLEKWRIVRQHCPKAPALPEPRGGAS